MSDKEKNEARAKEIFEAHSGKDAVHFTSDGLAFFNDSDAKNHAKTLKDSIVRTVDREDVYPSAGETDFEDDEDDDFLSDEDEKETPAAPAKPKAEPKPKAESKAKVADKPKEQEPEKVEEPASETPAGEQSNQADGEEAEPADEQGEQPQA